MSDLLIRLIAVGFGVHFLLSLWPHLFTRRDSGGSPDGGLVLFIEPLRWLGVPWGLRSAAAGLRKAGYEGEFRYWPWHSGLRGTLVLPVLASRRLLEAEAQRLAEFIAAERRSRPDREIRVIGYSCGGYVAVRALELLDDDIRVDAVAILAGAFSPWRDLSAAAGRVRGKLAVCSSLGDWMIVGLGTLLLGPADRVHTPSIGMLGVRSRTPPANLAQIKWAPKMLLWRHWGGHFSAASETFVARRVAPALGIGGDSL